MFELFKKSIRLGFIPITLSFFVTACEDNPADPGDGPGEGELITTVTLTLTEVGTTNELSVEFKDLDGDGGNPPTIGTLTLKAGSSYNGAIELLDETKTPAEDIAEEIKEEAAEHQFFYTPEGGIANRIVVDITDHDVNGLPVGLEFTVVVSAGDSAAGTLKVTLYHYDTVTKDGVRPSDETDVEIDFSVNITN